MERTKESKAEIPVGLVCIVCGSALYSTDHGNRETTYHCSSPDARFWDFERGTQEQVKAKEHWDRSIREVFTDPR